MIDLSIAVSATNPTHAMIDDVIVAVLALPPSSSAIPKRARSHSSSKYLTQFAVIA